MGILQARILEWMPCPPPGDLPNPGIEPRSPTLQVDALPSERPEKSTHMEWVDYPFFRDLPESGMESGSPEFEPMDVGNLISGSSAFSKSSLNIWNFSVHIILKPSLKDFEHYLATMWTNAIVQSFEHFLALPFFGTGMKSDLFQSCGHWWVFQICSPR